MNRFEIIKDIDEGAFGFVQMARNKETGEIVAIKKIKKKYNSWDECMNLREIRSLKKLKHPNVIRLKEVFKLEQELFLVFEYARTNLFKLYNDEYKERGQGMPERLIKSIIFQAVSALVYIHKAGFFHRDMKPENLLMNDREVLKIADFGLAREIRSSPPYTEYVSTRWYRSPEILLKSTNYNSPVDIWALGCIMAELYLNGPLFNGTSEMDQMAKIAAVLGHPGKVWHEGLKLASQSGFVFPNTPPQNLEDILKGASPLAIDMIRSMLNYDSSKRPTAAKLLQHPYLAQENDRSLAEIPATIPFSVPVPTAPRNTEIETKPSLPLNQLNNLQFLNQPSSQTKPANSGLGGFSQAKQPAPVRNLISELENNWRDHSYSSKKFNPRVQQSPLPKPPSKSPIDSKLAAFEAELDLEERKFQQNLDSMFSANTKAPLGAPQIVFLNHRRSEAGTEGLDKGHCTAKKKQMDADLEELEHYILATKKKGQSPGRSSKSKFNPEKPVPVFEESAVSRKKGIFYNQNSNDNGGRGGVPAFFNDQLEELLNREQKILEQRSMKAFEGKFGEGPFGKKNDLRIKNGAFEAVGGSDNLISSEASKFKNSNTQRGLDGNSLVDLEVLPQTAFRINRFQTTKMGEDSLKNQTYGAHKF